MVDRIRPRHKGPREEALCWPSGCSGVSDRPATMFSRSCPSYSTESMGVPSWNTMMAARANDGK